MPLSLASRPERYGRLSGGRPLRQPPLAGRLYQRAPQMPDAQAAKSASVTGTARSTNLVLKYVTVDPLRSMPSRGSLKRPAAGTASPLSGDSNGGPPPSNQSDGRP